MQNTPPSSVQTCKGWVLNPRAPCWNHTPRDFTLGNPTPYTHPFMPNIGEQGENRLKRVRTLMWSSGASAMGCKIAASNCVDTWLCSISTWPSTWTASHSRLATVQRSAAPRGFPRNNCVLRTRTQVSLKLVVAPSDQGGRCSHA